MEREVNMLEILGRHVVTIETLQGDLRQLKSAYTQLLAENKQLQEQLDDVKESRGVG